MKTTQKHTHAPWFFDRSGFITDENEVIIAQVEPMKGVKNEYLISSAPELFAALSDFLEFIDDPDMDLNELKSRARAALNKAGGNT